MFCERRINNFPPSSRIYSLSLCHAVSIPLYEASVYWHFSLSLSPLLHNLLFECLCISKLIMNLWQNNVLFLKITDK